MRVDLRDVTRQPAPEPTPYVPIAEAAKALGLSPDSIRRAIKRDVTDGVANKFGGDMIGSRYIIRRIPFERYLRGEDTIDRAAS